MFTWNIFGVVRGCYNRAGSHLHGRSCCSGGTLLFLFCIKNINTQLCNVLLYRDSQNPNFRFYICKVTIKHAIMLKIICSLLINICISKLNLIHSDISKKKKLIFHVPKIFQFVFHGSSWVHSPTEGARVPVSVSSIAE